MNLNFVQIYIRWGWIKHSKAHGANEIYQRQHGLKTSKQISQATYKTDEDIYSAQATSDDATGKMNVLIQAKLTAPRNHHPGHRERFHRSPTIQLTVLV